MRVNKNYYKKIGAFLRSGRKSKKITLNEIADELELTSQQVQKYETGQNRIPIDKFCQYCDIVDVHPQSILDFAKGQNKFLH